MSSTQQPFAWSDIRAAFDHAMELPEHERCAYLRTNYSPAIAAEAQSLLEHHVAAASFLAPPPTDVLEPHRLEDKAAHHNTFPDTLLADRYLIKELIGEGGTSWVHRAKDQMTGDDVVVKIIAKQHAVRYDVARLEASALRLLALPGIVRLLDEGIEGDQTFLVMEYVEGKPYPGWSAPLADPRSENAPLRHTWQTIRQPTIGLLETLSRVHSRGIVHADLKPGNVLVRRNGSSVVLDLGISRDPGLDRETLRSIALAGTPRYISPEQLDGKPATAASDLYSLGIMLYEALAGCDPHDARTAHETIARRVHCSPPPLRDVAPDVPPRIAACIDRMIASDPKHRYPNALSVLTDLEAGSERLDVNDEFALCSSEFVERLFNRIMAGHSVDVSGPRRSGRSMTLRKLGARLVAEGRSVAFVQAGTRPFESLASIGINVSRLQADTRHALQNAVTSKLHSILSGGTIVMVPHPTTVDSHSREMLTSARQAGGIVRAVLMDTPGALAVPPVSASELMRCFHGRERIHYIPSDAAHQLWLRTGGRAGLVLDELNAWERAGLAHWDGDRMRIDRDAITRLRGGLRVRHQDGLVPDSPVSAVSDRPRTERALLACVDLLGRHASPARCAKALGISIAEAELQMESMEREGTLQATDSGGYFVRVPMNHGSQLGPAQLRSLHRGIASTLPKDEPKRMQHLILAGELDAATREAAALADTLTSHGRVQQAWNVVREGLRTAYQTNTRGHVVELLERMCEYALTLGSPRALALSEYELGRAYVASDAIEPLRRTMRAATFVTSAEAERALKALPLDAPPASVRAYRTMISVWMFAARVSPMPTFRRHLHLAERAVAARMQTNDCFSLVGARAWLAYREDDYVSAARQHLRAVDRAPMLSTQMTFRTNAASAFLEAGKFDDALREAKIVHDWASPRRHTSLVARSELMMRAARYRRSDDVQPDPEFVDACEEALSKTSPGMAAFNEAAIAWRQAERELANRLSTHAAKAFHRRNASGERLAKALVLATSSALPSANDVQALLGEIQNDADTVSAIQSGYLLSLARPDTAAACRDYVRERAEAIDANLWGFRREIVSIEEAVQ